MNREFDSANFGAVRAMREALGEPWPPASLEERIGRLQDTLDQASEDAPYLGFLHEELAVALWERAQRDGSFLDIADVAYHLGAAAESVDMSDRAAAQERAGPLLLNMGTAMLT